MIKKLTTLAVAGVISIGMAVPAFAHEVTNGDSMSKIAESHNMTLDELSKLNPSVQNLDLIYIGQTINTSKNEHSNNKSSEVSIKKDNKTTINKNSEVDLLARLIRAEAQGESYSGKVAVGEVVINRVNSSEFPNTIEAVIYQSGQFSPVSNGSINKPADSDSLKAAQEALGSGSNVGDALYFYNPRTASNHWLDSKPTKAVIGSHNFK
ncbi:cell wall hydrolase [Bacillus altitudinis]|uniref:cell wall hydrolase n=1 Tax=Bacillus altitudinis TaxID=293387 RepID=UPI002100DD1D|nr:cell wall hydrolase [Bacillus altitudinis]UTV34838.1 cell wall hydrolase [Bacillus altitudinis]